MSNNELTIFRAESTTAGDIRLICITPERKWLVMSGIRIGEDLEERCARYAELVMIGMDIATPTSRTFALEMPS